MNEYFTAQEFAELLKRDLDDYIKSIGKSFSALDIDMKDNAFFEHLDFKELQEECKKLKINLEFIGNTKFKKAISPKKYNQIIVISYENIPL